ncbi:MAG: pyridoxamine 5'-phosphate oxidase [Proteobacteria bacterium]|nr:MAG: pyridoxamine 5'-phosphate oxidase [Pseudomonadota bacterium]
MQPALRDAWLAGDPPADPLPFLRAWLDEARACGAIDEPEAAALATVDPDGRPSARIVAVRALDAAAGVATFYTDRTSRKGRALAAHPHAALVFHWDRFGRQARLEGPVTRASEADSDAYFAARHPESRIAAASSEQSRPIASRAELVARYERVAAGAPGGAIARPPHWGGYRVWIERLELWASRPGRLHDRLASSRALTPDGDGFRGGAWRAERLQP